MNGLGSEPKGAYFISYRRTDQRTKEAVLVRNALRDRGIPTWRDLDELVAEPTEQELIDTLGDPLTAGAVMLITPEVETSDMIRNVEAPRIFNRHRIGNGFVVHPVLIGLDYGQANSVLNAPAGFQDLGDWNLQKIDNDLLSDEDARAIASTVLRRRLSSINERRPDDPVDVGLFSRRSPHSETLSLRHDFTPYFSGRNPAPDAFANIECSLLDTASAVSEIHGEANIIGRGNVSLPLGVLFGAVYSPLAGFNVSWLQSLAGREREAWSLSENRGTLNANISRTLGDPGSEDLVLAIGVSANIQPAVTEFVQSIHLRPRASFYCAPPNGPVKQGEAMSPQNGLSLVLDTIEAVRSAKDDLMLKRARLHIFLACPLAMAVLLGQKLNTFKECVLYEHMPDRFPVYTKVHAFNPSGYTYHSA